MRYRQGDDQQLGTSDDRYFQYGSRTWRLLLGVDRTGLERAEAFLTVTPSAFRFIATGRVRSTTSQARTHLLLAVIERTAQATAVRYWRQLD